jgi:hypothetical protein
VSKLDRKNACVYVYISSRRFSFTGFDKHEIFYHLEQPVYSYLLTLITCAANLISETGFDSRQVCVESVVKCGTGTISSRST